MTNSSQRPLSPHLTVYKWGPHMIVSILHRLTGSGLAVAGLAILAWWLAAIAGGDESYARFVSCIGHPIGMIVLAGLTWAFWQHVLSGIRHLVMDIGAGFDLRTNRFFAVLTVVGGLFLTAATWFLIMGVNQ